MQLSIFDELYPKYKITKPIRLIELFSGYGSQALALKYLGVPFEHWRTCEWAVKSIQAYKDIHFPNIVDNPSKDYDLDFLTNYLYKKGISSNYNEPMTLNQIKRLNEKQIRTIYNNIQFNNNLVNIQQVSGEDLGIKEQDKYTYLLTYSFPCQDLSLAGKRAGMNDTSTRSGMLWEVERILTECSELGTLPQVLLMENVPQVHGTDNVQYFNKWKYKLEQLGYKNYFQDLIATDYGIPQTRNRCFMVSILGDYNYTFPQHLPLKLKLKDMLEDNVDEKYYLSKKMTKYISSTNSKYTGNNGESLINKKIANTITTREGNTRADTSNYICNELGENYNIKALNETLEKNKIENGNFIDAYNRNIKVDRINDSNNHFVVVPEATKKGYAIAKEGDGIDISYPNSKTRRGRVQKQAIQTLTTNNNLGVVNNLRIRKLTPKECFRLMGVKDEDYENCARNQSNASLYHLAGDSIVVNVLMAIFKELLGE